MPDLEIVVDPMPLVMGFKQIRIEQLPFAMKTALNATVLQAQRVQVDHDRRVFTTRSNWADTSIKVTHFATKTEQWATLAIMPPGPKGPSRVDILGKFEDQTRKTPFKGSHVAVPTTYLKKTKTGITAKGMQMSALNFQHEGKRILGWHRTFIVPSKRPGVMLVLQRVKWGAHASITQALYLLVPWVPITPDLDFAPNFKATVASGWAPNFTAAFAAAMRTAR